MVCHLLGEGRNIETKELKCFAFYFFKVLNRLEVEHLHGFFCCCFGFIS